jgi:hypothetical protein
VWGKVVTTDGYAVGDAGLEYLDARRRAMAA